MFGSLCARARGGVTLRRVSDPNMRFHHKSSFGGGGLHTSAFDHVVGLYGDPTVVLKRFPFPHNATKQHSVPVPDRSTLRQARPARAPKAQKTPTAWMLWLRLGFFQCWMQVYGE